jgi:hypothetical protein
MDQLRFEVSGENRYWIMSKTQGSQDKGFALYSPDDGYWWTYWKEGTGDMIVYRGKVGIGTVSPDTKLTVNGTTKTKEVIVSENVGADFVFEEDYPLPTISEIEEHIKINKHLVGIPSAGEMIKNGVRVGELQMKLLQKIEELTLYIIELRKDYNLQQLHFEEQLLELTTKIENLSDMEADK